MPKPAVIYYSIAEGTADAEIVSQLKDIHWSSNMTLSVIALVLFVQALFLACVVGIYYETVVVKHTLIEKEEKIDPELKRKRQEESEEDEEDDDNEEDDNEEPEEEKKDK